MAKKRKSIASRLDEVDRTMYASFSSAANSLSQLYTQGMNHQKLSFQAGERHGMEKLYQWILTQQEGGSRVTTADVINYIQSELDYNGEAQSMSPRAQHQHPQPTMPFMNAVSALSSGPSVTTTGQGIRSDHSENQSKNSVFSNALASPIRRNLQNYHITPGLQYCPASGNGARNNDNGFHQQQNRDPNPLGSSDSSMDMHADSPSNESL